MKMIVLLALVFGCSHQGIRRINEQFSYQKIDARTYVVTDETFHSSNVMVALMDGGVAVIASSPFETEGTQDLVEWVKEEFHPLKIIAVNTHFHLDGTGGNFAFKKLGVETWASESTQALHKLLGERMHQNAAEGFKDPVLKRRILNTPVTLADKTFKPEEGLKWVFGDEEVQVIYPGAAHSKDNMVVYLPQRKILFGGCMIRPSDQVGPLKDADIKAWPQSVDSLKSLDAKWIIPGHGPIGGPEYLEHTKTLVLKAQNLTE